MKSMTGYGNGRAQSTNVTVEVSVRAVNGRFLEPRFHLPREFMPFEGALKKVLSEKLRRGTVDVFITRRVRGGTGGIEIIVDKERARRYAQAYRQLAKELSLPAQLHLDAMARLPEVLHVEDRSDVDSKEEQMLKKAFAGAVDACDRERLREGKALRKELEKILGQLDRQVRSIQTLREEANRLLQEKYEARLQARLKNGELDPQRVSQEVVLQLDKSDINEELARLAEHLRNYRQLLGSRETEGKKLDFYTQELLREVNTIGSKSQVAQITQAVVEAKTLIERLREQVQNVE